MNVRLVLGILLLVGGLFAAAGTFGALSDSDRAGGQGVVVGDENQPARSRTASMVLPIVAGLAIAAGGALVALSMARFRHPRIVPPDSREGVDAPGSPPRLR